MKLNEEGREKPKSQTVKLTDSPQLCLRYSCVKHALKIKAIMYYVNSLHIVLMNLAKT